MAENSSVPVINALCDDYHPCQLLADLLAVKEHKGEPQGTHHELPWRLGQQHGQLLPAGRRHRRDARPHRRTRRLPAGRRRSSQRPRSAPRKPAARSSITTDAAEALKGADVVATDTWVSMGQEDEKEARLQLFREYAVDEAAMQLAAPDAVVLHCLPGLPRLRDLRRRHRRPAVRSSGTRRKTACTPRRR